MKKMLAWLLAACLMFCCVPALAEEEMYPMVEFDLDAYSLNGGMLKLCYADGTEEETGGWGMCVEMTDDAKGTIGDVLAQYDVKTLDVVNEFDTFEGWMVFDIVSAVDEDGFETYEYVKASEDGVYLTTEELLALPLPESYMAYTAKWAGIPEEEYYNYIEEEVVITMQSVTLLSNGGVMLMASEEGDYEATLSVATVEPGQLVGDVLELAALKEITREGMTFAGWTVYEVAWMESGEEPVEQENALCFEVFEDWYTTLLEYTVLGERVSSEDVAQYVCGELDLMIVAEWE